jgi:acetyl esterase/lipase
MNWAAEAMRREGLAVWNIEYRGVDEPGGGYPGTFLDVARATDAMREHAGSFNLDLERVGGFAHSAGGHLVMWLAARPRLPAGSAVHTEDPLGLLGVVNSGGLADLEASAPVTSPTCLASVLDSLTGSPSSTRPNVFADTSPAELLPIGVPQWSVNGDKDRIAPPQLGQGWTQRAQSAGDPAEFVLIDETGHVELVAPDTAAFAKQLQILKRLLRQA